MSLITAALAAFAVQGQVEIVDLAGEPDRGQIAAWREQGVAKIITLPTAGEVSDIDYDLADAVAGSGMIHAQVPTTGQSGPMTADQLAAVLSDSSGPVVIHCRSGNRARHLYAAALIRSGDIEPHAYRSLDPGAAWNTGLLERFSGAEID